jgi:hypothetical protein
MAFICNKTIKTPKGTSSKTNISVTRDLITYENWYAEINFNGSNILEPSFFEAILISPPEGFTPYMVRYKAESGLEFIFPVFTGLFRPGDALNYRKSEGFLNRVSSFFKKTFASLIETKTLVLGNFLFSDGNALSLISSSNSKNKFIDFLPSIVDELKIYFTNLGFKPGLIYLKDLPKVSSSQNNFLRKFGFFHAEGDPNMVLHVQPAIENYDQYLNTFHSKARTRILRAEKKLNPIKCKLLLPSEVKSFEEDIFRLYLSTTDSSGFNVVKLPKNYFTSMKFALGPDYEIHGFFLENKMIAFAATMFEKNRAVANFVGYETEYRHSHQLYLNLIIHFVKVAVNAGFKEVDFGRTAMTIKSSLGAKPESLDVYLRHENKIFNRFLPSIFKRLAPVKEWEIRNPFKEE